MPAHVVRLWWWLNARCANVLSGEQSALSQAMLQGDNLILPWWVGEGGLRTKPGHGIPIFFLHRHFNVYPPCPTSSVTAWSC